MSSGQGRKLLLVEDNEVNREMLQRRLLRAGYTVVCAADGQQALDQMRAETPDPVSYTHLTLPTICSV